jgi:hypothetical protein
LDVALHSCFHVLLGVSNVAFVRLETDCLIHHNQVVAVAGVLTCLFVPAVARERLEVFGDDIAVELGVEVTLEKFTHVGELVVRHRARNANQGYLLCVSQEQNFRGCIFF